MSFKSTTATALLFGTLITGCGTDPAPITSKSTSYEVADDSTPAATPAAPASPKQADATSVASTQAPPQRPAPMNQEPVGDAESSDAVQPTPEQLLTVIRRLREQEPKGTNQEEMIADFMKLQKQLVQAVDMLLEMDPADDVLTEAATAKIDSLTAVAQLGADGATDQVFAFTEELEKHPSKKVSAFARQKSFVSLLLSV